MGQLPLVLEVRLHAGYSVPLAAFQPRDLGRERVLLLEGGIFCYFVEEV